MPARTLEGLASPMPVKVPVFVRTVARTMATSLLSLVGISFLLRANLRGSGSGWQTPVRRKVRRAPANQER